MKFISLYSVLIVYIRSKNKKFIYNPIHISPAWTDWVCCLVVSAPARCWKFWMWLTTTWVKTVCREISFVLVSLIYHCHKSLYCTIALKVFSRILVCTSSRYWPYLLTFDIISNFDIISLCHSCDILVFQSTNSHIKSNINFALFTVVL